MKPAGLILLAAALACGQSVPREFDAVSIKPYIPPTTNAELCNPRGDPQMLTRTGCTLEQLVRQAYNLKPYQLRVKGPAWIASDRWIIQARLAQPATPAEMLRMLQPVLTARFHLQVHEEDQQASVYVLQVAGRGPKLLPATDTTQCGGVLVRDGIIRADCLTIADITNVLESAVVKDRPVIDRTSLNPATQYRINLEFSSNDDAASAPSIFSALPDQLGLELKPGKAPQKLLIIDSAQRPEPN